VNARTWTPQEVRALGVRTDLVTAASVLGVSRTTAYELARAGTFPVTTLAIGRRYVVPVAGLLELLGVPIEAVEAT
jgi:excisionase family DNA binding protein